MKDDRGSFKRCLLEICEVLPFFSIVHAFQVCKSHYIHSCARARHVLQGGSNAGRTSNDPSGVSTFTGFAPNSGLGVARPATTHNATQPYNVDLNASVSRTSELRVVPPRTCCCRPCCAAEPPNRQVLAGCRPSCGGKVSDWQLVLNVQVSSDRGASAMAGLVPWLSAAQAAAAAGGPAGAGAVRPMAGAGMHPMHLAQLSMLQNMAMAQHAQHGPSTLVVHPMHLAALPAETLHSPIAAQQVRPAVAVCLCARRRRRTVFACSVATQEESLSISSESGQQSESTSDHPRQQLLRRAIKAC